MIKAIIIHAWESSPEEHWYREEEKLLKSLGYQVFIPEMPGGKWPKKEEWIKIISELEPDEETVLIGHSLGAPAILRYLECAKIPVKKVLFIAGFAKDLGIEETRNFVTEPFDWGKIKENTGKIFVLNENNDPWVPIERGREIAEATGGEFIEVVGNVHFDKMDLDLINTRIKKGEK